MLAKLQYACKRGRHFGDWFSDFFLRKGSEDTSVQDVVGVADILAYSALNLLCKCAVILLL